MLPYSWKYPGYLLILAGMLLSVFYYFFDFQFKMPVVALYSFYMEQKFLAVFNTNFAEEVILLSFLIGFILLVFSKDRPGQANHDHLKGKALFKALFWNSIILLLSIVLLYGKAFLGILVVNIFSVFLLYLVFYWRLRVRESRS